MTTTIELARDADYGFCRCGCGNRTQPADKTRLRLGIRQGEPNRYIRGHQTKGTGKPLPARVWENIDQSAGPDACWPWKLTKDHKGYGKLSNVNGRPGSRTAHRLAYELTFGVIPNGLCVCHSCDNPACCNPRHLWLGTPGDNNRDMFAKGRNVSAPLRGSTQHAAKLCESDIPEIKAAIVAGESKGNIARRKGVSRRTIQFIALGKRWAHVG